MPSWFEADWIGGPFVESSVGLARILRADGLDSGDFSALLTGRSDRSLVELPLAPEGEFAQSVSVAPWPDDDEWRDFVARGVVDALPILQRLIGVDGPLAGELLVREANTGDLHGYTGVFYAELDLRADAVIEVGERVARLTDALVALRDDAAAVGRFRLMVAGGSGGSALVLLGLVLWLRTHRRRGGEGESAR